MSQKSPKKPKKSPHVEAGIAGVGFGAIFINSIKYIPEFEYKSLIVNIAPLITVISGGLWYRFRPLVTVSIANWYNLYTKNRKFRRNQKIISEGLSLEGITPEHQQYLIYKREDIDKQQLEL